MTYAVEIVKGVTNGPDDLSLLTSLSALGYTASDVVAVVSKTEGNGCVNDFSRTLASRAWGAVLRSEAVTVFSGGTEGVLSPHVSAFVRSDNNTGPTGAVVGAVGRTGRIPFQDVGRAGQMDAVRKTVRDVCDELQLTPTEVVFVLVKCPLLTSESVSRCIADGSEPATRDTLVSMALSRAASALGVAVALEEVTEAQATAGLNGEAIVFSSVASVSSGAELEDCHVLVLGTSPTARGTLRVAHAVMHDAMDAATVIDLIEQVESAGGEIVQVFAKAEADPSGRIRNQRHTMLTDSDLASTRHARAAVGGLLAGLVGDSAIYVSGGAESQGPPGGGPVTILYRIPEAS